jgi:hypothetical protein
MSKVKLTILVLFVVLLGALGGTIYYASTLVSPQEVRRITLEKLQDTFPNSQIELGELNFSIGTTFEFDLDMLSIHAPEENSKQLFGVEDVRIKVPVWAILFGGGEIEVQVNSPKLRYVTLGETNNWSVAMKATERKKEQSTKKDPTSKKESSPASMVVPAFLAQSQLNLRVSDLKIHYQLDEQKGELNIKKFLVRNLNFESSTAFEVDSQMIFELGPEQEVSFDTLIIGQFNLGDYIQKGELPIMAVIKTNNLSTSMLARPLSEIKTDLKIVIKEKDINANVDISLLKDVRMSAKLSSTPSKTTLSSIKANIPLGEVLSLLEMKLDGFNMNKAIMKLDGQIQVSSDGAISPDIKLAIGPSIVQSFKQESFKHQFEASLVDKEFESKLTSELFSGTLIATSDARLDINEKMTLENLPSFNSSVNLTNLSISESFIRDFLYSNADTNETKKKVKQTKNEKDKKEEEAPLFLPPGKLSLSLTNIKIADEVLSGKGQFQIGKDYIATKNLEFEYSEGQGKLTHLSKLKSDGMNHKFDFSLDHFNLLGAQAFLPPSLGKVSGKFSIMAKGSAQSSSKGPVGYDVVLNAQGVDGSAQVLIELEEKLRALLKNVPSLSKKVSTKKPLEIDGSYDELSFKSNLKDTKYEINKLKFIGPNSRFILDGAGKIYPPPSQKSSVMNFVYQENKGELVEPLRELTGSNEISFKLEGQGYNMRPDYGHTIEKLAKQALKNEGKKIIKKEKKKIESKVKDELEKKGKEKLKNLFGL